MKSSIALCLALVAVSAPAYAEDAAVDLRLPTPRFSAPNRDLHLRDISQREHDARVLRNVGIATVTVGTAINLIGVALLVKNLCFDDCANSSGKAMAGAALIGVGYAGILAGIPMWAVGGTRLKRAKAEVGLTATGVVGRF